MKKEFKKNTTTDSRRYVPAIMEVMSITSQSIICQSGDNENFVDNPGDVNWFN